MTGLSWRPITDEQRNGEEWVVGCDIASVWIVRSAWWSNGENYMTGEIIEGDRGWWSYRHSVSQDQLDGIYTPTHYLCETPDSPKHP